MRKIDADVVHEQAHDCFHLMIVLAGRLVRPKVRDDQWIFLLIYQKAPRIVTVGEYPHHHISLHQLQQEIKHQEHTFNFLLA